MAIEVDTQDCTALTDAELAEMADLAADGRNPFSVGLLSKETERWVLHTQVRDNGKLKGYALSTLERIGGTPSVIIGIGSIGRNSKRDTILRSLVSDIMYRALMAFPDEDVLLGARFNDPAGFDAFKHLHDVIPRPGHRANGEERAWGKRLAKRYGIENGAYDERAFIIRGEGGQASVLDHESHKPEKLDGEVVGLFEAVTRAEGDAMIGFGWAMAEDLEKLG